MEFVLCFQTWGLSARKGQARMDLLGAYLAPPNGQRRFLLFRDKIHGGSEAQTAVLMTVFERKDSEFAALVAEPVAAVGA